MTLLTPLVTGVEVTFWVGAPLMILCAILMVFAKKAVYSALLLAGVMIGLAALYASLDAPFLFVIQIVVYTGAIMMLFLFVIMLVGVDARESFVETIRGQRWLAILAGLGLLGLIIFGISGTLHAKPAGLTRVNSYGNVQAIAAIIFSDYVYIFEMASALLITAALGAMVLAHRERLRPRPTQAEMAANRIKKYAATGAHPGARPNPGVYARANGIAMPGLLPDGSIAEASVSEALAARGQDVRSTELAAVTHQVFGAIAEAQRGELEK